LLAILAGMSETILLTNDDGDRAVVALQGAELLCWRAHGEELIWSPDRNIWDQTAPILFPVVGWTRDASVRVGDRTHPLGLHGFAWKKRFEVAAHSGDFVRLTLADDVETRALYPFSFRLDVEFRLLAKGLLNDLVVTNPGDGALPYACGLHPAFRWPLAASATEHAIVFEHAEDAEVPIIGPGGLISKRKRAVPIEGRRLPLSQPLLSNDALCFFNANSRRIEYDNGAGLRLVAELRNFPHIAFWSLPPAPYLCVEPWTGHGDPEDFYGDLFEKPSMRRLHPGESARHGATFRLERSASLE
jgi:galactose mutarotase-like enzyme